jgi:phosphomannomutase
MNLINWNYVDLIVFDLDNTLTGSKIPMDREMAILLTQLLDFKKVAVLSGGNFKEFDTDLMSPMPKTAKFSNLHIFPMDGTAYYKWQNGWNKIYLEALKPNEKKEIRKALEESLKEVNFHIEKTYGEVIEDRESSIVFSALGQEAPLEEKQKWDPDQKKRFEIKKLLDQKIPQFEVNVAGTTSIDITAKGLDKAYGIKKMVEYIQIPIEKMIFIGDALFPDGNDYDVLKTNIRTMMVDGPEDTKKIIHDIIKKINQNA